MAFNTGPYRSANPGMYPRGEPVYPDGDYGQPARAAGSPYYSWENQPGSYLGETYGKSESDPRIWSDPGFENDLTSAMLNFQNSPLGQELMRVFQGSADVSGMQDLGRDIRSAPDYYNPEEQTRISNLITGKSFDRGVAGSLFDQISRAVAPQIEADRAKLGKAGINPEAISGVLSGAIGERDRAYTDAATKYQMAGTELGLKGRGQQEEEYTQRYGILSDLERAIADISDRSDQWRAGIGSDMQGREIDVWTMLMDWSRQQDMANKQKHAEMMQLYGQGISSIGQIGAAGMMPTPA